ncbi:hypothetical protein [Paenarthrobacter sp. A20]|uniref:hypothetical protein n=1 Tax=Paenarthrobacter sp. A20 TaxID=2817891 RepID=UPI00209EC998|nr:hypothetical protein [Paenarthrobacter sp. A20]MCP1415488.1 putative integral membrane protein [Paenarthrobacter sp. A20]
MAARTPRLVVDRFSTVFRHFIETTLLLPLLVFGVTLIAETFSRPDGVQGADLINAFITPWVDALFTWFVWKEPAIVLAVVVPLAIALQVAVHGLRAEISLQSRAVQPPRVREEEMRRVKVFSHISTLAASVITVFTAVTLLDALVARSGVADASMTLTVALCGSVTAALCLDASRVATTQDLEQRLIKAGALQQHWKKRLRPLRRDIQSRKFVWWTSGALCILVLVLPAALLEYNRADTSLPEFAARVGLVLGIAVFFAMCLGLNFMVFLILTIPPKLRRGWKVLALVLLGVPSCLLVIPAVLGVNGHDPFSAYAAGFLPMVAFLSMLIAFVQATRNTTSWITIANFGFHGLLRFWAVVVLLRLFRSSNDQVSWLKHALHEPPPAEPLHLTDTARRPKTLGVYNRVSGFLAGLVRR